MSASNLSLFAIGALLLFSCKEYPLIGPPNSVPTAVAQIIGPDGQVALNPIPAPTCAQPHPETLPRLPTHDATFDYTGSDVTITLDASKSIDPDGTIMKYTWLSGTSVPDGGMGDLSVTIGSMPYHGGGRWVPPGAGPDWPPDAKQVQVTLGQGVWSFVLWVTDNKGAISNPETITITIGGDPRIATCAADVLNVVGDDCKTCICSQSDTCRAAVVQSACDANCWGLINCIATMCPDFTKNPSDTSCVVGMCGSFLSGATAAMGAGMCITPCASMCAASSMGGDGGTPMMPALKCDAGM